MQIALLADKYDMATRIKYWSRLWYDEIKKHVPYSWGPSVISYIGLFSMLKMEDEKNRMMTIARGYVTENTFEHGLPIQHHISESPSTDSMLANNITRNFARRQTYGTTSRFQQTRWYRRQIHVYSQRKNSLQEQQPVVRRYDARLSVERLEAKRTMAVTQHTVQRLHD